jgi:uncharacterized protein (DUF849 family)
MTRKVWLEVALNGTWGRKRQPKIPVTVEEVVADGIACVQAGASILHLHALDPETSEQNDDPDIYQAIFEGIRAKVDAIVYPTMPIAMPAGWSDRYAHVEELGRRGLLEWAVVDPGSININFYDARSKTLIGEGVTYANSDAEIRQGMELAARFGFHPEYACFEPGFVRLGAAMQRAFPKAPQPIYSLRFTENLTTGFPPRAWALDAYLKLIEEEIPGAPWMAASMAGDIAPMIPEVIARGGHVRTGLEDAPLGSTRGNVELVEACVAAIRRAGAEPASAAEVRAALARTAAAAA